MDKIVKMAIVAGCAVWAGIIVKNRRIQNKL